MRLLQIRTAFPEAAIRTMDKYLAAYYWTGKF